MGLVTKGKKAENQQSWATAYNWNKCGQEEARKNLPKNTWKGKSAGRISGQEPRLKLKALPTGFYNVIEKRPLLK